MCGVCVIRNRSFFLLYFYKNLKILHVLLFLLTKVQLCILPVPSIVYRLLTPSSAVCPPGYGITHSPACCHPSCFPHIAPLSCRWIGCFFPCSKPSRCPVVRKSRLNSCMRGVFEVWKGPYQDYFILFYFILYSVVHHDVTTSCCLFSLQWSAT